MTDIDTAHADNQERWARGALGLGVEPSPEETRRALFDAVEYCGFVPDGITREAIAVFCRTPNDPPVEETSELHERAEKALLRDVASFARRYFDFDPADRTGRWHDLSERAKEFPAARTWLSSLSGGLALASRPQPLPPEEVRGLIESLKRIYPAAPFRRAEAMDGESLGVRTKKLGEAAGTLRRQYPEWLNLLPGLAARLEGKPATVRLAPAPANALADAGRQALSSDRSGWATIAVVCSILALFGRLAMYSARSPAPEAKKPTFNGPYSQPFVIGADGRPVPVEGQAGALDSPAERNRRKSEELVAKILEESRQRAEQQRNLRIERERTAREEALRKRAEGQKANGEDSAAPKPIESIGGELRRRIEQEQRRIAKERAAREEWIRKEKEKLQAIEDALRNGRVPSVKTEDKTEDVDLPKERRETRRRTPRTFPKETAPPSDDSKE